MISFDSTIVLRQIFFSKNVTGKPKQKIIEIKQNQQLGFKKYNSQKDRSLPLYAEIFESLQDEMFCDN